MQQCNCEDSGRCKIGKQCQSYSERLWTENCILQEDMVWLNEWENKSTWKLVIIFKKSKKIPEKIAEIRQYIKLIW